MKNPCKNFAGKLSSTFDSNTCWIPFFTSLLCMGLGYGLYKGVIDNYLAEIVEMGEFGRGVAEFFRELPGFMLVFILALLYRFSAESIFKIGGLIMLVGMILQTGLPADRVLVTTAICIYSLGEHIQLGMRNTLSLEYSQEGKGGRALGFQNSIYQGGTLAGFIIVMIAFTFIGGEKSFRLFFAISALIMGIGTVLAFRMNGDSKTDKSKSKFYFRKKYTKFYILEVFYGARKQIFFTFGPYVLILFYKASTSTICLLFAVSAICCALAGPIVGKIIDKLGYKIVMISDTLILVIVCFFYGFAHRIFPMQVAFIICCINYILDSVISLASMASNVYVQDISDSKEEVRATISTGISVNHFITILIALFGGWIWQTLGLETLFTISAVLGILNSIYAATIKVKK
ncbi:MAG: MFS transporter [Treponema sp.]|nr:MFS transporter [Treponema sp.]